MATSQQQVPQEKSLVTEVTSHKKKPQGCKVSKSYISFKRQRTWHWQDATLVNRSPTNFAERTTHGCGYLRWIGKRWTQRAHKHYKFYLKLQNAQAAICYIFGQYCGQALAVAWCESKYSRHAHNGQYLGIFQMGSNERAIYGHSDTFLGQAIAAHRYFVASGRDWSPWSCKPW